MAEAIISRRGFNSSGRRKMTTELITTNSSYVIPNHNGQIHVRIFGAGGGTGSLYNGGGSGYMNNGEFDIPTGTSIPVTIGICEGRERRGGTTSFGTYLSANGGSFNGSGGSGGGITGSIFSSDYASASQFGGGGGGIYGGNGGIWGGGGGQGSRDNYTNSRCHGGSGGTYGGGGGGAINLQYGDRSQTTVTTDIITGGNGGEYGGGGGGGGDYWNTSGANHASTKGGIGGINGGNGGHGTICFWNTTQVYYTSNAENGINTIGMDDVPANLQGDGLAGVFGSRVSVEYRDSGSSFAQGWSCGGTGGGGFGGRGGSVKMLFSRWRGGGGGGGYGGNGGSGGISGGGGGGYGGSGGNGDYEWIGGGGGGYFGNGSPLGGGGGYFTDATGVGGAGYSVFATGGENAPGNSGVCIIQYYA